jgi:DHA2 family multidrug resistance protein
MSVNFTDKHPSLHKWLIAISVFTGAVMGTIDTFILYVATPHLRGVFSATISEISWVSTSYATSSLIFMLLSGSICRRYGVKTSYQTALLLFIASSVLCGASDTLGQLILARIVQGASAGILIPSENVILRKTFPVSEHAIVMGIYSATIMVGPAVGPLVGGFIIDNYHWSYIFYINVPIGIFGFLMANYFVPKDENDAVNANIKTSDGKSKLSIDFGGIFLLIVGMFTLIWLLERGERLSWLEDDLNVFLMWTALFSIVLFCVHEATAIHPSVDLSVLRFKVFRTTVFLNFLLGFIVTATLFLLPIYMQELLNFSPTQAGLSMAPRALFMMIAFPLVGYLMKNIAPKMLIYTGALLGIYSSYLMSLFTHETGMGDMYLPQILQGLAVVFILLPLTTIGLMSVSKEKLAAAAGFDSTARLLGGVFGIATFASLLSYFQETTWGIMRENVSFSYPVLYKRFGDLINFWLTTGASLPEAQAQAAYLLYGRVTEQVLAITYMRSFQIILVLFCVMFLISLFANIRKPEV